MTNVTPADAGADLLRQLDDIRGLGPVSAWPLAPGWWGVIALTIILMALAIFIYLRRRRWRRSWKSDAARTFAELERNLDDANAQAAAAALSVTLRRIAMHKFSRADCAGLEGESWLRWLQDHDPAGFGWIQAGAMLIDAPYAPPGTAFDSGRLRDLLGAARKWVA